jgi:hypothetical protein
MFSKICRVIVASCALIDAAAATSEWVHPGPDGKLVYQPLETGDRIMDFSFAGYGGGGVAFPDPPVAVTINPSGSGDDDASRIQAAIDSVAASPLVNGIRGTVLLGPGEFHCGKTIVIAQSGIVLRGSGASRSGSDPRTTIIMVAEPHTAFVVGAKPRPPFPNRDAVRTAITDRYVPVGAKSFNVEEGRVFAVGDRIAIVRPATRAWMHFMQMDDLVRARVPQQWFRTGEPSGITVRTVTRVTGNTLECDLPLCDSYDAKFLNPPGTTVAKIDSPIAPTNSGVEHLRLKCPPLSVAFTKAPYSGFRIVGDDCWLDDIDCEEVMNATNLIGNRLTLRRVRATHTYPNRGAAKPSDFGIQGSQILIDRCEVTGDNEYFVWTTGHEGGPNVVLNSVFRGRISRIQPHSRWSTGMLVDNCVTPDDGIDFMNRGVAGNGFGWGMGWGVAWNCVAHNYLIQTPPGAANWAIGCIGEQTQTPRMFAAGPLLPVGIIDSAGVPVAPQSLYLAQLQERLGTKALEAIGYAKNSVEDFPGRDTPPLPPLPADIDPQLGANLALRQAVDTSSERENLAKYGGESALDGGADGYWATKNGDLPATLEIDLEGPVAMNTVMLEEARGPGHAIKAYRVEGMVASDWQLLASGTTIGARKVASFPTTKIWKVRLTITDVEGYVALHKLGLYSVPEQAMEAAR